MAKRLIPWFPADEAIKEEIEQVDRVKSNPPVGHFKVLNIWLDSTTGKIVVQYDDIPTV
jgi:hypothetical protein